MKIASALTLILTLLVQEGQSLITAQPANGTIIAVPIKPYFASMAVEWQGIFYFLIAGVRRMFLKDSKINDDSSVTESMLVCIFTLLII
jgi:hypothetical protein